jgi:hypothetical protein
MPVFALGKGAILAGVNPLAPILLPLSSPGLLGTPLPIKGTAPNGFVTPRCRVRIPGPGIPELAAVPWGLPVPRADGSPATRGLAPGR